MSMLAWSQASDVEALVQHAVEHHRELSVLRQRIAEAQALQRQAGIRPVPTVEFNVATGRPLATKGEEEYTAAYFHPIETSGKRQKRLRLAGEDVQLAQAELAERVRQLAAEIKSRFIDAVAEQKKLGAIDRLVQVNQQAMRLTQARVEKGDVAPLERDLLAVELSRVEALRSVTLGRLTAAVLDLRKLAAAGAVKPTNFSFTPVDKLTLNEFEQHALKTRPDLQIARLLEEQGAAGIDLAEAEAKPNVTLSARYARRSSRFDDQFGFTASGTLTPLRDRDDILAIGVSIPLLKRNRNLGNIEAAGARLAAARLHRQYLEEAIPLEVTAAQERYLAARRALEIYDRGIVDQSEKNLNIIRQAYTLGQLRMLDVLNEQRRLIDTQLAAVDARAEEGRAFADLVRAIGGTLP
jgi:cobalt-zinc-cadmium efflux system outer membrane protein